MPNFRKLLTLLPMTLQKLEQSTTWDHHWQQIKEHEVESEHT
jgi:hypothetical protein